jgi:membrane associated rhomboid family serine protease
MFLPYRTTTPLYYFPWCTIGIIAANTVVFFGELGVFSEGALGQLVLTLGDGVRPWQWLTSNFIHADLLHLAGNMIFLWVFGQITEGRLGPSRFLLVYLGIGIVQCAGEQAVLLGMEGGASFGASAIIFGLLAMSLVWAPEDEVYVWYWIFLYFGTFSLRTKSLAVIYLLIEAFFACTQASLGAPLSSEILHLSGAGIGLVAGIVILRKGWIEVDGRDFFTLHRIPIGPREKTVEDERPQARWSAPDHSLERRLRTLELIREQLRLGDAATALSVYRSSASELGPWPLPEPELRTLIKALAGSRKWNDLKPLLVDYARRYPDDSGPMRLLLARIHLEVDRLPQKAIQVLDSTPASLFKGTAWEARQKLIERARAGRSRPA